MRSLSGLDWAALAILVVGGLNWGLVGFFGYDLVAALFGELSLASRTVYALVGLCALYVLTAMGAFARRGSSSEAV